MRRSVTRSAQVPPLAHQQTGSPPWDRPVDSALARRAEWLLSPPPWVLPVDRAQRPRCYRWQRLLEMARAARSEAALHGLEPVGWSAPERPQSPAPRQSAL